MMKDEEALRLLRRSPALNRADWLPEGTRWPELDALRVEHHRLLAARSEADDTHHAVKARHEAEDKARAAARQAAYRDGGDPPPQERVSHEERAVEVREAMERSDAAHAAYAQFVSDALAEIAEHAEEWLEDLALQAAEARAKRDEAKRLLAEAEAAVVALIPLRQWVNRNADPRPGRHISLSDLGTPQPERVPDLRNARGAITNA